MSSEPARPVDRAGWLPGRWDEEPDRVEFRHAGLPCLLVRSASMGAWCGYVGVPPGHPAYGEEWDSDVVDGLDVHGGISYAGRCSGVICHVPQPGESDDVWWLGFDCCHAFDVAPKTAALLAAVPGRHILVDTVTTPFESYKSVNYVRREVEGLAEQLAGERRA